MLSSFWNSLLTKNADIKTKNQIFYSILKSATPIEIKEDEVVINCDSNGSRIYLEKKKQEIERMVSAEVGKKMSVTFVLVEKPIAHDAPLLRFEPSKEDKYKRAGLNPTYTFENFAVSSTNQVAFAAAQAVAQNPGSSYNPLFLYGGVGVGKTHIAQAIARELLEKNADTPVYFCSGERFMNDLIESIREKNTPKFRKKYRSLQLIIIDDIQFIAGKQTVQEEFFHTFNSIVSGGGQVVLTSDRPPFEIRNLEDRLRSRFSGGLIVDIQQPDFELRTAIILIKAKEKNIEIDIDAAKIIAETVTDARSLEGMLLSLYARSLHLQKPIDLDVVEDFFKQKAQVSRKKISPQDIIKTVCSFYNIKQTHLKGDTRKSNIALARQVVMYILRKELNMNLEEVAYIVKRKDHTTVMHAVAKIQSMAMKDGTFREELDTILQSIRSST